MISGDFLSGMHPEPAVCDDHSDTISSRASRRDARRDDLSRERAFEHLQKHTLMSQIRGEITRIFAPDPYGVKSHKWPW